MPHCAAGTLTESCGVDQNLNDNSFQLYWVGMHCQGVIH